MRLHVLAVGTRMPAWVDAAFEDYSKRLPPECGLLLKEIASARRRRGHETVRSKEAEGERLLAALPRDSHVVALDERGAAWRTRELAAQFEGWLQSGRAVALMIGGPDGLAAACKQRADAQWSLSPLTLPHALVRVIVAEQLYRAWSMIHNHPYHRS